MNNQPKVERIHETLGEAFFDPVRAASFPTDKIRFRNDQWARRIGLDKLTDAEWRAHFGAFEPLPGGFPEPLALRYHGHQFRNYNPDIGDGRGFLFAQLRDLVDGRLLDLGTKGSGTTPYSRFGDGRLTLKGGVREILATEMLEALGVYTSKSLSLIETGEALQRNDEPSPTRSSVLVRLSHSHVRIGTFQRFAAFRDTDALDRLTQHCITYYWPDAAKAAEPVDAFFANVVDSVAQLGAEWYVAGFVHGVLNTDNINITGESFDYGPWRFLDRYDSAFTAAYFDQSGLYNFGRQPEALNWNLARLGECLLPLSSLERIQSALDEFPGLFQNHLTAHTLARLGLTANGNEDQARAATLGFWRAMQETSPPVQQVFHDVLGARSDRIADSPIRQTLQSEPWLEVIDRLGALAPAPGLDAALSHPVAAKPPQTMIIEEVEAIWSAIDERDDWEPLNRKVEALRRTAEFNATLGLQSGENGRAGQTPLGGAVGSKAQASV